MLAGVGKNLVEKVEGVMEGVGEYVRIRGRSREKREKPEGGKQRDEIRMGAVAGNGNVKRGVLELSWIIFETWERNEVQHQSYRANQAISSTLSQDG